jgi:phosphoribosylformylglycinamidine synthase
LKKKKGLDNEAQALKKRTARHCWHNGSGESAFTQRYDVQNIEKDLFEYCKTTVFAEPQLVPSSICRIILMLTRLPWNTCRTFDQRPTRYPSASRLSQGERPTVRTARVFSALRGLTNAEIEKIKRYVINR